MYSDDLNKASFKDVDLRGAKINGQISMNGVNINGRLNADSLHVGESLFMNSDDKNKASFKEVDLANAKITGHIKLEGASIDGPLNANGIELGQSLLMNSSDKNKARFETVDLRGAQIGGQINMTGASFDGVLEAESLQVNNMLFMADAYFTDNVNMGFAHLGANLDLRGATFHGLNLSGASISGEFQLGGGHDSAVWKGNIRKPGALTLRNTHFGNLMDATNSWPERGRLHLDGVTFNHLGGFAGESGREMRSRGMVWWDNWARLDTNYSPAPYVQLAAALMNAGHRDDANEIRYLGRVRERETETGLAYVWSGFLQWVAGFGIGTYTFRVLYWVIAVTVLGALYLQECVTGVRDEKHGIVWCFGASLSRLLPIIEIKKDFTDFFNNSQRNEFTGIQSFFFATMGIVGWLFGAILIAAVAGLTQGS